MKNKIYGILLVLFMVNFVNAQSNFYYYYKGNKVFLELDKSKVYLVANQDFNTSETSNIGLINYTLITDEVMTSNKSAKIEFVTEPTLIQYYQKVNLLKGLPNVKSIGLYFKKTGMPSIGTSNYFYVKLKSTNDFSILQNYCLQNNVQIVKQIPYMPEWYILSTINPQFTSLELSNIFYESNLFADTDPAFMFNFETNCANDAMFGSLWGLNNLINSNYDLNVCQAWDITEGNGINVAVIDTGIDLTHDDLITNIHPLSYDCQTQTSPSILRQEYFWYTHGTHVAGTIGAIKDNGIQVVGVAPSSKLMSISHALTWLIPTFSADLASGFGWAWQNGAHVINCSWGDPDPNGSNFGSPLLENAINNAMILGRNGLGCVVVFATGNENGGLRYPASQMSDILAVGSITSSGFKSIFSNFGNLLDVVAPGSSILSTLPGNQVGSDDGTSMASPHAAGVAALVLSINPCLTGLQVRNIIELTSQKINPNSNTYTYSNFSSKPNGVWNSQVGYGLVDAHAAVLMAQSMGSTILDLMVKDGDDDIGEEPNITTQYLWASPDIWVRNNDDIAFDHQNPEYHPTNPNYAHIKVSNKSCITSSGNEVLKLYWAKAGSSLAWPDSWDGNHNFSQGPLLGAPIGQIAIPILQPGQETIVTLPFLVPDPAIYNWFQGWEQWHFCLLARIESIDDSLIETTDLYTNVQNNNGIAWKNITVVDVEANVTSGTISVGNPFNTPRTFFLEFIVEDLETGKPIFEEAEVGIKMDETLFLAWERGGNQAQQLEATIEEKRKVVIGNNVILDNIAFNANEIGSLTLDFNFLIKELTDKQAFKYHIVQRDALTGAIIGGETYEIKKNVRNIFEATAPDNEVDLNQPITISAEDINEPAIYNWYDNEGNLIYEGKNLHIATAVAEKYKLEVIATTDSYKDFKEVEVRLKPSKLENISPNPATNNVLVSYKLNGVSSAYLMVIGYYGSNGISNNYILEVDSTQTNLNISNYLSGCYTIALIVNGEIIDAKTLVKQ